MPYPGNLIMIDGIAGSGKTTVINAMFEQLVAEGRSCWRLQDWKEEAPPRFDDVKEYDVLFTYEPTRHWVGAAIRNELSHNKMFRALSHAHAFALDREIQYRRLIIPALQAGRTVIQDRGVSTSLVYQPTMAHGPSLHAVKALPGNVVALANAPQHLVITRAPFEHVAERIRTRADESKGVYSIDLDLLRRADERFRAPWFRKLFESRGTTLHDLDTSGTLEQSKANAIAILSNILKETK